MLMTGKQRAGKELDDGNTLACYDLQKSTVLHLLPASLPVPPPSLRHPFQLAFLQLSLPPLPPLPPPRHPGLTPSQPTFLQPTPPTRDSPQAAPPRHLGTHPSQATFLQPSCPTRPPRPPPARRPADPQDVSVVTVGRVREQH